MSRENANKLQAEIQTIEEILQPIVTDFMLKSESRYALGSLEEYRDYFRDITQKLLQVQDIIAADDAMCQQDQLVVDDFRNFSLVIEAQVFVIHLASIKQADFFQSIGGKLKKLFQSINSTYSTCIIKMLAEAEQDEKKH